MITTVASVTTVLLSAGLGIGTSDTFSAALLFSHYVENCGAYNKKYNEYDNNIFCVIRHDSTSCHPTVAGDLAAFSFEFSAFMQRDTIIAMKTAIATAPPTAPPI